jgi:hypothetical protein
MEWMWNELKSYGGIYSVGGAKFEFFRGFWSHNDKTASFLVQMVEFIFK